LNQPNQDNFFINHDKRVYAVFDGHGDHGHYIASYLKHHIAARLSDSLNPSTSVLDSLRATFRVLDEAICSGRKSESSGSTCAMAYIDGDVLYVAGIGDCSVVLVQADESDGALTTTSLLPMHKLSNQVELSRISKTGAQMSGDYIVSKSDPNKIINMTRAFGDQDMKSAGIISVPELSVTKLSYVDLFSVQISDSPHISGNGNQSPASGTSTDNSSDSSSHNADEYSRNGTNQDNVTNLTTDQNNLTSNNNSPRNKRFRNGDSVGSNGDSADSNSDVAEANNSSGEEEPSDVGHYNTSPNKITDRFLMLASDGLEQVNLLEMAQCAHKLLKSRILNGGPADMSTLCSDLLKQLEDRVYERDGVGFSDDATVIVVVLSGFSIPA